jgi:hypothetical protein
MARAIKHNFLIAIILITTSAICIAEPDTTMRYLIDEPMSMLDFGLYKLNNKLKIAFPKNQITAMYLWDENRIILNFGILLKDEELKSENEAKTESEQFITKIRWLFGIDPKTGRISKLRPYSGLDTYFEHSGYTVKTEPKDLNKKLFNITKITGVAGYRDSNGKRKSLIVRADLLGSEIYFAKNKWLESMMQEMRQRWEFIDEPKDK